MSKRVSSIEKNYLFPHQNVTVLLGVRDGSKSFHPELIIHGR